MSRRLAIDLMHDMCLLTSASKSGEDMLANIPGLEYMDTSAVHLQMVVVSEPRLVAELLHSSDLAKPTQPVMVHFRQVRP